VESKTRYIPARARDGGEDGEEDDTDGEGERKEMILPDDVKYALELGGEQVVITREEKERLRRFDTPGLVALVKSILNSLSFV
jgi:hypothetical protein